MLTTELYAYQDPVVDAALARGRYLMAADMGLGKTIMAIAVAEELLGCGDISLCLIVCPSTLKYQWAKSLAQFTDLPSYELKLKKQVIRVPRVPYAVIIGGKAYQRDRVRYTAADDRARQFKSVTGQTQYVIVSYESVLDDSRMIRKLHPGLVILDECTQIKSFRAQRAKKIKKMLATEYRLALTGTPIENGKPEELFCADEETEILSRRGWLRYDQLVVGDTVLTLNHTTGLSEWQQAQAVNVFPVVGQEMLSMKHRDHSSLTTLSHRWPVERVHQAGGKITGRSRTWAMSASFRWGDRVPVAAECADLPPVSTNTNALVELVAWLYTEGHIRKLRNGLNGTAVNITQNTGTLGEERILASLTNVFGPASDQFPRTGSVGDIIPRWRVKYDGRATVFVLNTVAGSALLEYAPQKVPSRAFLLSLTADQLTLFIETSMLADNNGKYHFSQKSPEMAEAFQFACILAGYGTAICSEPKISYDRSGNPYHMTRVTLRRRKYFSPGQSPRLGNTVAYTGNVWCPTTSNGTWLARRDGSVYFTGNSIMQWVDEDVLGRWDLYDKTYIERSDSGMAESYKNLPVLRQRLAPAMARLSRHDPGVREYLPEVTTDEWSVELEDGPLRDAYMSMGHQLHARLKKGSAFGRSVNVADFYGGQADESTKVGQIMAVHTAMQQLLDHPDLVVESGMAYQKGGLGSGFAYQVWQEGLLDDVWTSPKLELFTARLERLLAFGGKVLVFTRYAAMLELLADAIEVPSVQYHGGLSAYDKASAVAEFGDPWGPRVFLSSHAGAYGCDMFMADHLVNYDNPWSPGRADQVNSRHVRASSEFGEVFIHNMIVSGTIEERIMSMQDMKRRVSSAVTDGHGADRHGRVDNDVQSLTSFLEETVDGLV